MSARSARRSRVIGATALLVVAALFAAGGYYLFSAFQEANRVNCLSIMGTLAASLRMYARDNGAFPPAGRWSDVVAAQVTEANSFVCPARPGLRCGYAFNSALAGMRPEDIKSDPKRTVLLFESDRGWNATGGKELLPSRPRHGGGDCYAFVQEDGGIDGTRWCLRRNEDSCRGEVRWDPTAGGGTGRGRPGSGQGNGSSSEK